jgi:hypothetical protein
MYVLTIPQAAATLAVTLIGFEIGLFGTSVVNAVLVLILVSIVLSALLAERVVDWIPAQVVHRPPLGGKVLVVTTSTGPTDAAVRVATLLSRPDGGHSDVVITRMPTEPTPDRTALRAVEKRIFRHGFDGHVRTEVDRLHDAVAKAILSTHPSLVVVDEPTFDASPSHVPVLVVHGAGPGADGIRVIATADDANVVAAEVARRLARSGSRLFRARRRTAAEPAQP